MRYLMGIDNGGTFSKAAIFDEDGKQISVASVPTVTITPKPGYTERDMDELWDVNAAAVNRTVTITKTIQPRVEYEVVYKEKYATYRAVIEGLSGVWTRF